MWILAPSELERLGWRFMTSLCAFAGYETFHGRRPDGGALIAAPGQTGFIHVHGSKANMGNVKAFAGYEMFHGRRPDGRRPPARWCKPCKNHPGPRLGRGP